MKNELYIHGEPHPRKRFFVMDERTDGEGDRFGKSFFSKEEAIAEADFEWSHMTAREKRERRVYVGYIDESIPDNVLGDRSIIGDIDPNEWDEEMDDEWYLGFDGYVEIYECVVDENE